MKGYKEEKHGALREVSFIDEDVKAWLDNKAPDSGLCVKRFKADFTVAGLADMKVGDRLTIYESYEETSGLDGHDEGNCRHYEITLMGKRCFPECELFRELGEKCPLATGVAFGKRLD